MNANNAKCGQPIEDRLRALEDREEIRALLVEYGRTLDKRDFGAFANLFADQSEYVGGGGSIAVKGPAAIARFIEEVFRKNPSGVRFPNFHLFCNETIQVNGEEAFALSRGLFVVPTEADTPELAMLATYIDTLIRENGRWKFKRRVVQGDMPAPSPEG